MDLVNAEFEHLDVFSNVPRIEALRKRYENIKQALRRAIFREFRDLPQVISFIFIYLGSGCRWLIFSICFSQLTDLEDRLKKLRSASNSGSKGNVRDSSDNIDDGASVNSTMSRSNPLDALQDAHRVVSAMGQQYVVDLMDQVCQIQLIQYDKVGGVGGFLYSLQPDALEKRWTGLRKLVHVAETTMAEICPPSWYFAQRLYLEFAHRTKEHFSSLLQAAEVQEGLEEKDHAALLMTSLKSVLRVEEEMTSR